MNSVYHKRTGNAGQYKWRSLLLTVKLPALLLFLSTLVLAQGGKTPADGTVCPLSESQTQKSIEAFSKIASTIASENRCLGCHGRVNPFIEEPGEDKENPDAPKSEFAHGGEKGPGAVDRTVDCNDCHSNMARRRNGSKSNWMTAPDFLSFVGKDAPTLCKQIRDILHTAKDFLGHLKDDNGGNNFAGTAFNGDRGLDRTMYPEKEVPTQKPHITHAALMKLGQDWVNSTGGEFKGDKSCGCEPAHYALRYSTSAKISLNEIEQSSAMEPLDIPLTFNDDGTFTGDAAGTFQTGGVAVGCSQQSGLSMKYHVTGNAIETSEKQCMHVGLGIGGPMAYNFSGKCPDSPGDTIQADIRAPKVTATYDMKGEVGEAIDKTEDSTPGITNSMHLEIVKTE
jgi:hypothetical protein